MVLRGGSFFTAHGDSVYRLCFAVGSDELLGSDRNN